MKELPTQNIYASLPLEGNEILNMNIPLTTFATVQTIIAEQNRNGQRILESTPVLFVGLVFSAN
jgi:hypothetical protein